MNAMPSDIHIELHFGWLGRGDVVRISGEPDENAMPHLADAASQRLGYPVRDFGRDGPTPFFLWLDLDDEESVLDFVVLDPVVSFAQLQAIIGTAGACVRFVVGPFGGDGLDPFTVWNLADIWGFLSDALTAVGALEIVTRVGRAALKRRNRERRDAAELWLHEGGSVPVALREEVARSFEWSEKQLATRFGLDRGEAIELMRACGYSWSAEQRCFVLPERNIDAVS